MPRNEYYSQCRMKRANTDGSFGLLISWIPADIAKVGNVVRLKADVKDEWDEGWEVVSVGVTRRGELVEGSERNHRDFQHSIGNNRK